MATDPNNDLWGDGPLAEGPATPRRPTQTSPYARPTFSRPASPEKPEEPETFADAIEAAREQTRIKRQRELSRKRETDEADRKRLAGELGLRPSQIIDVENARRTVRARRHLELRDKYPALAKVLEGRTDISEAVLQDEEPLTALGTVWEFLKNAPGRLFDTGGGLFGQMGSATNATFNEFILSGADVLTQAQAAIAGTEQARRQADQFSRDVSATISSNQRWVAEQERRTQASRDRFGSDNWIAEGLLTGLESIPLTLGAVATRNPTAGATMFGIGVGADSFQAGRRDGLTGFDAIAYGATQGLAEATFERLPIAELINGGGRNFIEAYARYMMREAPTELATTTVQSFTDWAMLPENRDRTFEEWAGGLPGELGQTILAVAGGGTVTVGAVRGFEAATNYAMGVQRRNDIQRARAAAGRFEGDFLNRLGEAAIKSATRTADPEQFAQIMRSFADDAGVSTVLVSGEAMRDYMQSDAYNRDTDPLAEYEQRAMEAAAAGNDVAITVETALTNLPGSPAWAALKDDMRITAGGMSKREADAYEAALESMDEEAMRSEIEQAEQQGTAREARIAKIKDKLESDGGFAPFEAQRQAELLVARMTTRAERMGRDSGSVDQAIENFAVRQVMPPELARAMAAEEQDMVIAALRGNERGSTSRARAAAQELAVVLQRRGFEPGDLSDDQLREIVTRMQEQEEARGREYRADEPRGARGGGSRDQGGKYAPLPGATKARGWHGPVAELVDVAEAYAAANGIDLKRQAYFVTKERFDEEFASRIAQAYEEMEHAPTDPAVAEAYAAMIEQTRAQYDALVEAGFTFTFFDDETDPYEGNPFNAMRDLRDNKTMAVYSSLSGYGSGYTDLDVSDNPLLADTGLRWPDQNGEEVPVLANDLFRAVHDAFGHGLEGAGFRYDGEENAWQAHARLFTGPALAALTSETRGQNSWLNFGPRGEENRFASLEGTTFADQKVGLLPAWAWTENVVPDMPSEGVIGFEVAPDPNNVELTSRWDALSPEAQAQISAEIAQVAMERLTAATGASFQYREQLGGYEGAINVSYAAQVEGDPVEAAKALGFVLAQDSVIVDSDQEFEGGEETGVISLDAVTEEEARALGEALFEINEGNPGAVIGFSWSRENGELVLLNTGGMETAALAEAVAARLGDEVEVRVGNRYVAFIGKEEYGYADSESTAEDEGDVRAARAEVQARLAEALGREGRSFSQEGLTRSFNQQSPLATRYEDEARAYRQRAAEALGEWRDWHRRAIDMGADAAGTGPVANLRKIGTPEALALAEEGERLSAALNEVSAWPVEQVEMFPDEELGDAPDSFIGEDQDFIEIDGEEYPTRNADGDLIAPTRVAMEAFWRWFGDSALVDSDGRPRVWYHGSKSLVVGDRDVQFREFATNFFAADGETARNFSAGGEVFKVYLKADKLAEHDAEGRMWDQVYEPDQYEIDEAMDQYVVDQLADFTPSSAIEEKDGGIWRVYDAPNEEYSEFDNEDEAQELFNDAVDRERDTFEEELRKDTYWYELQEKEYLSGRSTDAVAESDTSDGYDVTLIENVDEGSGPTDIAIVLADPRFIKATENLGAFDPTDPRIYMQANWFYSALERAAEAVKTARAPAQQWIATLSKAPGVKQEELDWTGIIDWLEAQEGPVDREAVIDAIQRGGVQISEIELAPVTEDDLDPALIDERVWDQEVYFFDSYRPSYRADEFEEEFEDEDGETETVTRWRVVDTYGDPFDDEVYIDEDDAIQAADEADMSVRDEAYDEWERETRRQVIEDMMEGEPPSGGVQWAEWATRGDSPSYRELLITLPPYEGNNPNKPGPTHFDGSNGEDFSGKGVLLHVRFADATGPNGERILFLEEVQSDWHQRGRSEGYDRKPTQAELDAANEEWQSARVALGVARAELEQLVGGPVPDGAQLSDEALERPGVAAAHETFRAAQDRFSTSLSVLNAVERGADADTLRKAIENEREAEREAREAELAENEKFTKPMREVLLPLYRFVASIEGDENPVAQRNLMALEADRLTASDAVYFYGAMSNFAKHVSAERRGEFTELFAAATDVMKGDVATDARERNRAAQDAYRLRQTERSVASSGGSIPDAPFKGEAWTSLAMKRMIAWASEKGYDQIAWIKEGEQNAGRTNDSVDWFYGRNLPNITNKITKKYGAKVKPVRVEGNEPVPTPRMAEIVERRKEIGSQFGLTKEAEMRLAQGEETAQGIMREKWGRALARVDETIASYESDLARFRADLEAMNEIVEEGGEEALDTTLREELRRTKFAVQNTEQLLAGKQKERGEAGDFDERWPLAWEAATLLDEYRNIARTAPTNLGFDITPELRKVATESGFPLFQRDHRDYGPRGRILFPGDTDQGAVIELFQGRDLSTLIHESSHLWLEELKADAADPNAPEQITRDYQIVLDWFRANGHEVRDGIIPVGAHELWARAGERYMREGKAPSVGLKRAFETFRQWLTNLYQTVAGLRAPITPEIREVFDRLLATDAEIAEARNAQGMEALFDTAMEAGMSPDEFANYREQVDSARAEAQGKVLEKAMAHIARREKRLQQERRREVRNQMEDAIEQLPLFKALARLREQRMSRAALVGRFGEDVLGQLPTRVPPLYAEDGVDPELIAEMSGFSSAQAMIQQMTQAEAEQRAAKEGGDRRNLKNRLIDQMTDRAMEAQFGPPLTQEQMREEALDAVANDRQGEVIASEIRALARKTNRPPTPYRIAREWARGRVRSGIYVEEASKQALQRHRNAIAKAGREAEAALIAGDMEAVYRAKQKQMLSSALLAEAKEAHEEVEAARSRLDRIAKARTMPSVAQDYLEQAHALLESIDLKQRSQSQINERLSFEAWAATRPEGEELAIPERLDFQGKPWSRLPVEQFLGLDDTIKSIIHLGRHKQTLLDNQERRSWEAWRDEARANLESTPGRKIDEAAIDEQKRFFTSIFTNLMKIEVFATEMDNGQPDGVWSRLLTWRATEAANYRDEQRDRVLKPIADAYNALSNKERDRLSERVEAPGLVWKSPDINDPRNGTPIKLTRWNVLAMALNMGTESNLEKLAEGYGISADYAEAIAMEHLNEREWQFVQTVWDSLESLWPDIERAEREMSGVAPERVEVRPVNTPFGQLRGGYYPVVYDPRPSQKAEDYQQDAISDLFGKRSGVATPKGHTKSRTGYSAPILLSPEQVLFTHVEKVVTRNAYAPWARDVLRAVKDPSLRALIDRKFGPEFRQQIEPWLRQQVREGIANESAARGAENLLRQARVNVTVVSMGLRWSTGVAQTIGLANSIGRIGLTGIQRGARRMLSNPSAAWDFVSARSPEMVKRNEAMNRDVAEAFRQMRAARRERSAVGRTLTNWQSKAQAVAFWHIGMIDRWIVAMPTWLGAYENAVRSGSTDEEASRIADAAVRLSQGSGREKDLSAWQSNQVSEGLRFLTMFYTPFNVLFNAQWEVSRSARRGDWRKASMLTFWFLIATPLFDALLAGDVPDDDGEEGWAAWLLRNVGLYQLAGVPILRDAASYAERTMIGEYATFNPGPLSRIFTTSEDAAQIAWDGTLGEDEVSERWVRTAIETPGYFLGLPTGQVSQTMQFLYDVEQGRANPVDMGDWYEGLTKGRIKEEN